MRKPQATCPQCGGGHEFDEEGKLYSCYFCCDTGTVDQSVVDAIEMAEQDFAEQFRPKRLGVFVRPMKHEYDWDLDEDQPQSPGHRLFQRLVAAPRRPVVPAFAQDDFNDIPF